MSENGSKELGEQVGNMPTDMPSVMVCSNYEANEKVIGEKKTAVQEIKWDIEIITPNRMTEKQLELLDHHARVAVSDLALKIIRHERLPGLPPESSTENPHGKV